MGRLWPMTSHAYAASRCFALRYSFPWSALTVSLELSGVSSLLAIILAFYS